MVPTRAIFTIIRDPLFIKLLHLNSKFLGHLFTVTDIAMTCTSDIFLFRQKQRIKQSCVTRQHTFQSLSIIDWEDLYSQEFSCLCRILERALHGDEVYSPDNTRCFDEAGNLLVYVADYLHLVFCKSNQVPVSVAKLNGANEKFSLEKCGRQCPFPQCHVSFFKEYVTFLMTFLILSSSSIPSFTSSRTVLSRSTIDINVSLVYILKNLFQNHLQSVESKKTLKEIL